MRCSLEAVRAGELLLVAVLGIAGVGCGEFEAEPEVADVSAATVLAERPCPSDSILSYENFGAPFFSSWCNGCHAAALSEGERQGAPLGTDYEELETIRSASARIWLRAGDHNLSMPPLAGPEDEERARLGEWLACGAPSADDLD